MSKERKFHELIERQNREEKDRVWAKIQQKETEQAKETAEPVLPKTRAFSWKRWAVAASSLAVAVGVFAVVEFFPFGNEEKGRYFSNQSYEIAETQDTLKEYAEDIGKDLLYFDWYAETDHLADEIWQLKDTQEIICFHENIVDMDTGCLIDIFVIDAYTEVEALGADKTTESTTVSNGISINWRSNASKANANFEYEGYKYYLRVEEPDDDNYILSLVEELLA